MAESSESQQGEPEALRYASVRAALEQRTAAARRLGYVGIALNALLVYLFFGWLPWRVWTWQGLALAAVVVLACATPGVVAMVLDIAVWLHTRRERGRRGSVSVGIWAGVFSAVAALLALIATIDAARTDCRLRLRSQNAMNLRRIGQAMHIYADGQGGTFPADLLILLDAGHLAPHQLVNPKSGSKPAACDYYYVTGLVEEGDGSVADPRWPVAWENPAHSDGKGANVLFVDGHVEFVPEPEFSELIEKFKREYQGAYGEGPVIVPPSGR